MTDKNNVAPIGTAAMRAGESIIQPATTTREGLSLERISHLDGMVQSAMGELVMLWASEHPTISGAASEAINRAVEATQMKPPTRPEA